MKRGYLWVDWVELGCRGWDLVDYGGCGVGASLLCSDVTGAFLSYHKNVGFRLHVNAPPKDAARVWNDLLSAGLFRPIESYSIFTFGTGGTQTATFRVGP